MKIDYNNCKPGNTSHTTILNLIMNALHPNTERRLKKIQQIPHVWEGDRRKMSGFELNLEQAKSGNGECIIWVDGSEGFVRAMDMVPPEMGLEAIVRTLLRAMENPHNPGKPARPQKIIVRDREIQFFLRGALQNLGITIDYVPNLPLIDELFRGFEEMNNSQPPSIPPSCEKLLVETASQIWNSEPWNSMADYVILAIEVDWGDVGTLYACILGMLGKEYGVILYRSLESLKRFRAAVLGEDSMRAMEKAFLTQDCWFLNFEPTEDIEDEVDEDELDLADLPPSKISPIFGCIHSFEGMRPFLDEEEALVVYVALQGTIRFFCEKEAELSQEKVKAMNKNYCISVPSKSAPVESVSVKVSTMPDLTAELMEMLEQAEQSPGDRGEMTVPIKDDLVPENALITLDLMPWEIIQQLAENRKIYYQSLEVTPAGEGMPVVVLQTTRPKAKVIIEKLQGAGGLKGISFNPGEDTFSDMTYDLGILQTNNGELYMLTELYQHHKTLKKWHQCCQITNGYCGLVLAMGITGASRGNPKPRDLMAFLETKAMDTKELGIGGLQLMPD